MSKEEVHDAYAALEKLASTVRRSIEQWEQLPKFVKAGRVVKARGYTYRVIDYTVCNEIGYLVDQMEFDAGGKLIRVKLAKPDPKMLKEIEALLASKRS